MALPLDLRNVLLAHLPVYQLEPFLEQLPDGVWRLLGVTSARLAKYSEPGLTPYETKLKLLAMAGHSFYSAQNLLPIWLALQTAAQIQDSRIFLDIFERNILLIKSGASITASNAVNIIFNTALFQADGIKLSWLLGHRLFPSTTTLNRELLWRLWLTPNLEIPRVNLARVIWVLSTLITGDQQHIDFFYFILGYAYQKQPSLFTEYGLREFFPETVETALGQFYLAYFIEGYLIAGGDLEKFKAELTKLYSQYLLKIYSSYDISRDILTACLRYGVPPSEAFYYGFQHRWTTQENLFLSYLSSEIWRFAPNLQQESTSLHDLVRRLESGNFTMQQLAELETLEEGTREFPDDVSVEEMPYPVIQARARILQILIPLIYRNSPTRRAFLLVLEFILNPEDEYDEVAQTILRRQRTLLFQFGRPELAALPEDREAANEDLKSLYYDGHGYIVQKPLTLLPYLSPEALQEALPTLLEMGVLPSVYETKPIPGFANIAGLRCATKDLNVEGYSMALQTIAKTLKVNSGANRQTVLTISRKSDPKTFKEFKSGEVDANHITHRIGSQYEEKTWLALGFKVPTAAYPVENLCRAYIQKLLAISGS